VALEMTERLVCGGTGDPAARDRPLALVTLDHSRVEVALRRLGGAGVHPDLVIRWGDVRGYREILSAQPPLILLDASGPSRTSSLVEYVRALDTLGAPVVFAESPADPEAMFRAGAVGVVDSSADSASIAGAIRQAARRNPVPGRRVPRRGELFVVSWLLQRDSAFCCHLLRRLLGRVNSSFSLPAVRSLLFTAEPALNRTRRTLEETRLLGGSTFAVVRIGASHLS